MCDQNHFEDDAKEYAARGLVTRREFGALVGAGVVMMLPRVVNAVTVTESDVNVRTPDGTADCYFVHPASGTAPAPSTTVLPTSSSETIAARIASSETVAKPST